MLKVAIPFESETEMLLSEVVFLTLPLLIDVDQANIIN